MIMMMRFTAKMEPMHLSELIKHIKCLKQNFY